MAEGLEAFVTGFNIGYQFVKDFDPDPGAFIPSLRCFSDLVREDGITFEIGERSHVDDEEFTFTPEVQFSNEEMLNMLNMNDFEDEDQDKEEKGAVSLCGMSFAKLKTKMTDVNPDGKVMKYVKQEGIGEVVSFNARITIHYVGYFEYRDEPFDSTYSYGKPRTLRLGQSYVLPGLEIAIRSMKMHEIAVFLIHPDLAYKAMGCPPRIPPNEEVVFVVHLIDYVDDGCAELYEDLSPEEKQLFNYVEKPVAHMLVTAKDYFKKMDFKHAIREYKKAIDHLESVKLKDSFEEERMNRLLTRAYTNLGICYNKVNIPTRACSALRIVPIPTAKSRYNHGKALLQLGEYKEAMKELQKAHKLHPQNQAIIQTIHLTNKKQREYLDIEKNLWQNCFRHEEPMKLTEFRKATRSMCEDIMQAYDVMRISLPEGFTKEEEEVVREEAAVSGLDVVTTNRYGKETVYLQKNKS